MADDDWGGGDDGGDWGAGGGDDGGDWGAGGDGADGFEDGGVASSGGGGELTFDEEVDNKYVDVDEARKPADKLQATQELLTFVDDSKMDMEKIEDDKTILSILKTRGKLVEALFQTSGAKKLDEMLKNFSMLMELLKHPKVSQDDVKRSVESILDIVSTDNKVIEKMYDATREFLNKFPHTDTMRYHFSMKQIDHLCKSQEHKRASALLEVAHQACRLPNGVDNKEGKGSELIEIYAMKVNISFASQEKSQMKRQMKDLYERTKDLTAKVNVPKYQSVIKECWGRMFGNEGDWQRAYAEFFNAFTLYQEARMADRAKSALKYVVVANMLCGGLHNPFDAREAKALQKEDDIKVFVDLRAAFDKNVVADFNKATQKIFDMGDDFIITHLESMIWDFQSKSIKEMVKSYRRIGLDFLATKLKIDKTRVQGILIQLILDGGIFGKIDQVKGILDLSSKGGGGGGGAKYHALDTWSNHLSTLSDNFPAPHAGGMSLMR